MILCKLCQEKAKRKRKRKKSVEWFDKLSVEILRGRNGK
jgi:hypothetical protein